jgi:uncharacterized protein YhdP
MVVDARAMAKQLDLGHVAALVPALRKMALAGKVDADLDIHFPRAALEGTRVRGTVRTRNLGFRVKEKGVTVKQMNSDLTLTSKSIALKDTTLRINDQKLEVSGRLENFRKPNARLLVTSPYLDVDRLLPEAKEAPSQPPSEKASTKASSKKEKKELHPALRNLTAQVQVEADKGRYRGQEFKKLKLKADYVRGKLKYYDLDVLMGGGHITASGTADLRNPERIPFTAKPVMKEVDMAAMAAVLGLRTIPAHGPLSLTGEVQGRTGARQEFMRSLDGNLAARAGPGVLTKSSGGGGVLVNIMEFVSVAGILSGRVLNNLQNKGVAFKSLKAQTDFARGNMRVNMLRLVSDAANVDATGSIDLVSERLNMYADVEPFQTASSILGVIPKLGKSLRKATKVKLRVGGTLDDPKTRILEVERQSDDDVTGEGKPMEKSTTPQKRPPPEQQLLDTIRGLKGLLGK